MKITYLFLLSLLFYNRSSSQVTIDSVYKYDLIVLSDDTTNSINIDKLYFDSSFIKRQFGSDFYHKILSASNMENSISIIIGSLSTGNRKYLAIKEMNGGILINKKRKKEKLPMAGIARLERNVVLFNYSLWESSYKSNIIQAPIMFVFKNKEKVFYNLVFIDWKQYFYDYLTFKELNKESISKYITDFLKQSVIMAD